VTVNLKEVGGIYFVTYAEHPDYIKIGRTKNYHNRFLQYLTHTPFSLEILLLLPRANSRLWDTPPSSFDERGLHRKFKDQQYKNEWFHNTEALRKNIHEQRMAKEFEAFIFTPEIVSSPIYKMVEEI